MMEFKGKKVLFYIMLATMMIPSQAIIIANYLTIADWGIRNTYAALILLMQQQLLRYSTCVRHS